MKTLLAAILFYLLFGWIGIIVLFIVGWQFWPYLAGIMIIWFTVKTAWYFRPGNWNNH